MKAQDRSGGWGSSSRHPISAWLRTSWWVARAPVLCSPLAWAVRSCVPWHAHSLSYGHQHSQLFTDGQAWAPQESLRPHPHSLHGRWQLVAPVPFPRGRGRGGGGNPLAAPSFWAPGGGLRDWKGQCSGSLPLVPGSCPAASADVPAAGSPSRSEAPLAWLWAAGVDGVPSLRPRVVVGGCSRDTLPAVWAGSREPQASHHISSLPSTEGQPVSYYFDWACLDPAGSAKEIMCLGGAPQQEPMYLRLLCDQGWPGTLLLGPLAAQGQKGLCSTTRASPSPAAGSPRAPERSSPPSWVPNLPKGAPHQEAQTTPGWGGVGAGNARA